MDDEDVGVTDKKVYILLTDTGTLFTRVIRLYTKANYNHVCIGFDRSLEILYSFGRKKPSNPFIAGFVNESIRQGIYEIFSETSCSLYCFEVNRKTYNRIKRNIRKFEKERDKYSYNLIGLLGVMYSIPIQRRYSYFCSQFVATVLKNSGIDFFNKSPALVAPHDFENIKQLRLIYRGKLKDYSYSKACSSNSI